MTPSAATAQASIPTDADDIRDIHGLVRIPSPWDLLPWIALACLLAAGAAWLARRLRRATPPPPDPTPDAIALAALERARAWMKPDEAERFGTAISTAIRQYIEARFEVSAPRRTTEEFLRDLTSRPVAGLSPHVRGLEDFLRRMDLVKFARAPLDETQMEGLLDSAYGFVRETRRPTGAETSS